VAAVTALVMAAILLWWTLAGLPKPVATALADAEWAPCVPKYDSATSARDTARVDSWILKPRSRFTPAVTCGRLRRTQRRLGTLAPPHPAPRFS
jgi:hypothetical protein